MQHAPYHLSFKAKQKSVQPDAFHEVPWSGEVPFHGHVKVQLKGSKWQLCSDCQPQQIDQRAPSHFYLRASTSNVAGGLFRMCMRTMKMP